MLLRNGLKISAFKERVLKIEAKVCGMGCIYRIELKKMCEIGAEML